MGTSNLDPNTEKYPYRTIGGLGLVGMLLEVKHGIPALVEPYADCHSWYDVVARAVHMDDGRFLGWLLWIAILAASTLAICKALYGVLRHFFRPRGPTRE